ncbi:MAG TPA: hypothetical protein ENK48_03075 [Gammaproteobacteria bacterium]|nr:hypothetical protein [Gammaproteobacteria bacterium]
MKKIDIAIIRLFQFLVLMFFTFAVFLYYGSVLMLALALLTNLTALFGHVFGAFLSAILGFAVLLGLCYYIAKLPRLVETFLGVGMDLIRLAHGSVSRFGALVSGEGECSSSTPPPSAGGGEAAGHKA